MVQIRFYRKNKGSIHMVVRGHAGSAPKGEDLVCACATMLSYTAAQAVQFLYDEGRLACAPKIRIREGEAVVIATPKPEHQAEVLQSFWTVQCGAHCLAHSYPRYVRLEHLRV